MKSSIRINAIVVIITLCIVMGIIFLRLIFATLNQHIQTSKAALAEYDNLFATEAKRKLKIVVTAKSATRNPVSNYTYNERFNIEVFKIDLTGDKSLKEILLEKNKHAEEISGILHPEVDNSFFIMKTRIGKVDTTSVINFTFEGDSIQTIAKNDSIACYYLKIGTFSVGYDNNPQVDIWGSQVDEGKVPISIAFLKKKKTIYFLLLHVKMGKQEMTPDILCKIIQH